MPPSKLDHALGLSHSRLAVPAQAGHLSDMAPVEVIGREPGFSWPDRT